MKVFFVLAALLTLTTADTHEIQRREAPLTSYGPPAVIAPPSLPPAVRLIAAAPVPVAVRFVQPRLYRPKLLLAPAPPTVRILAAPPPLVYAPPPPVQQVYAPPPTVPVFAPSVTYGAPIVETAPPPPQPPPPPPAPEETYGVPQ